MTASTGSTARAGWALGLAAAGALVAGSALLQPGFYDSHDGLLNVHRLFELERCVADGQLPCRWVPDMGAGYGYPLFDFYPPLASHVALVLHALGFSLLAAVKGAFLLALVVAAISMFALAREFFGPAGGLVAAVLYVFAPYQAVDVFVRGALAESWGLALVPLVFWTGRRAVVSPGRRGAAVLACAVAWALLLLAHDVTALMAAPVYAGWLVLWLVRAGRERPGRGRRLGALVVAHVLAVALAGWFVVPSLLELRYVHADTLVSLYPWARFENNFLSAREVFAPWPHWGYGAFRTPDGMALFVGPVQLLMGTGAGAWLGVRALTRHRIGDAGAAALLLGGAGLLAATMTLAGSRFVWEAVPPLAFLQFPWRFLAVASFGLSFAGGWIGGRLATRPGIAWAVAAAVCVAAITVSWGWFRPSAMHVVRDEVLANPREVAKARHGLFDFLPRSVDLQAFLASPPPLQPPPVETASGDVSFDTVVRASDRVAFDADVEGPAPAVVRINVYEFPGWTLEVDGEPAAFVSHDDPLGRLHVELSPGRHRVTARFTDTPVRSAGNVVSLVAAMLASLWLGVVLRSMARAGARTPPAG